MKRFAAIMLALVLGLNLNLRADEGMWIPMLINKNIVEMQKMGLKLSAEDIYSVNHSSLKDAVVIFGGGCTGEIISPEGLLITNHHCGYGSIQKVSTGENNYLKDGFWATNKQEEIPIEGLTVKFMVRMQNVTKEMLSGVKDGMEDSDRQETMQSNEKGIIEQATKGTHYNAIVETFYGGNEYYLVVYETFKDVRLTGAPPESIGKYGADTDNWMWPRHTGDFSMFRVYSDPDGNPAEYSAENIPLKPKHFLPISIAGIEEGDFSMILGNPGSTQRYLSSYGVDLAVSKSNMTIVKIREEKLRIMHEGMEADEAVRLQYASKYARTANYWKYFIGQTKGLIALNVEEKKLQEETDFQNWLDQNPTEKMKYGEAIPLIAGAYDVLEQYIMQKWYFREAIYRGPEILGYAYSFNKLNKIMADNKPDTEVVKNEIDRLEGRFQKHFKDYNFDIDRNLLASMLQMFHANVPLDQQPVYLLEIDKKYKGDYDKYAHHIFEKSLFGNEAKLNEFFINPKANKLEKDPVLVLVMAFFDKYKELAKQTAQAEKDLAKGSKLYIAGLREMNPDKNYYPDANFTMRLTYGKVGGYYPSDAVYYDYYTTMDGIMQKENPDSWEFIVPEKLKELYNNNDFGPYAREDGKMPVCFLTNHDITGGNSGSPVLNANGELTGLAFDGNWEAMSGDIAFEPDLQRTINVDIRYVLFIIDKFAGAQNLIDEMVIVKERTVEQKQTEAVETTALEEATIQ
jgi:hypothetical protein